MAYKGNSPRIGARILSWNFPVMRRCDELHDDARVSSAVIACLEEFSLPAFYRLLSEHLDDKAERDRFLRDAGFPDSSGAG